MIKFTTGDILRAEADALVNTGNGVGIMGRGIAVAAALLSVISLTSPSKAPVIGNASVVDGDTFDIGDVRIRLNGVDAPEPNQTCTDGTGKEYRCGRVAASALDAWLAEGRPVTCDPIGKSRDRIVANCRRADGSSVNKWLVQRGYAVDWPKYSLGAFGRSQAIARSLKRGIWEGEFVLPCQYRAEQQAKEPRC